GVQQSGVGAELADGVAQALVGGDGLRQGGAIARKRNELALVACLDVACLGPSLCQVVLDCLRGGRSVDITQVPNWHGATARRGVGGLAAPARVVHDCSSGCRLPGNVRSRGRLFKLAPWRTEPMAALQRARKKASTQGEMKRCIYPYAAPC